MKFVIKTETLLDTYVSNKFYEPIRKFMDRYPAQSMMICERYYADPNLFRFFQFVISGEDGAKFRAYLYDNPSKIVLALKKEAVALGKCGGLVDVLLGFWDPRILSILGFCDSIPLQF